MAAIHPRAILDLSFSSSPNKHDTTNQPNNKNNNNNDRYYYVLDDNASDHCSHSYTHISNNHHNNAACTDFCNHPQNNAVVYLQTLIRRSYHGLRQILVVQKHHDVYAMPIGVVLVVTICALAFGLLLGYLGGKRKQASHGRDHCSRRQTSSSSSSKKTTSLTTWIFERRQNQPQQKQQQQKVSDEPKVAQVHEEEEEEENQKNTLARLSLSSSDEMQRESGVSISELPQHVAVIMDGNRRYGESRYGSRLRGHSDGSRTLLQFAKWCLAEHIPQLTVYALSTENWHRHPSEIQHLMDIIYKHCQELRTEAIQRSIRVCIISTNNNAIPQHVRNALENLQQDTKHGQRLRLNICLSYGGRGEIVAACQNILNHYTTVRPHNNEHKHSHHTQPITITEEMMEQSLHLPSSPDVLIRTSNEYRLSNFLLWQLAYTELFFLDKYWPQLEKQDLLNVLQEYAKRQRRYGT